MGWGTVGGPLNLTCLGIVPGEGGADRSLEALGGVDVRTAELDDLAAEDLALGLSGAFQGWTKIVHDWK